MIDLNELEPNEGQHVFAVGTIYSSNGLNLTDYGKSAIYTMYDPVDGFECLSLETGEPLEGIHGIGVKDVTHWIPVTIDMLEVKS